MKSKRGQLGIIEFKYFLLGLVIGLVVTLVLVFLGSKGIIPEAFAFACSSPSG